MLGNRTLVSAVAMAILALSQPAAMETHPVPRLLNTQPWDYTPRRGKGERKRERLARWSVPQRSKQKEKNYGS